MTESERKHTVEWTSENRTPCHEWCVICSSECRVLKIEQCVSMETAQESPDFTAGQVLNVLFLSSLCRLRLWSILFCFVLFLFFPLYPGH